MTFVLGSAGKRFLLPEYPTRPVAKSLLPDPTRTRGLITRPDPNPRVYGCTHRPLICMPATFPFAGPGSGNFLWLHH